MSIQLLINAVDFSSYVISSERYNCVCKPIGTLDLQLAANLPANIDTYQDVEFWEDGVKVFTGYTGEFGEKRLPYEVPLQCFDVLIKAKDTWLETNYISNGETVGHWVGVFLSLAGLNNRNLGALEEYNIFEGFGWQYMTAWDAITQALQMCPYQLYADRNGVIQGTSMNKYGAVSATITDYMSYERTRDDGYLRNRAVVFGYDGLVADIIWPNTYLPNETRAVVVATGQIYNQPTADEIARRMLYEFSSPLDVKVLTIPGDPSLEIGNVIKLTDSWSGFDASCVLTSLQATYDKETYKLEIALDERCPKFWGWDTPPPEEMIMYAATWGQGVYRSPDAGVSWGVTALAANYVYAINVVNDDVVWASCQDGVYYTEDKGGTWTNQTMGNPLGGTGVVEANLDWIGIVTAHNDPSYVYVLATYDGFTWIYYSLDNGFSWNSRRIF